MQNITEGPLLLVREGFTARIIINRPEKKNALNNPMLGTLVVCLKEAIADDEIRSIVLTGQGAFFSSGRDIKELSGSADLQDDSLRRTTEPFLQTLALIL